MASPPKLTAAQRAAALEKAGQARRVRAELKVLISTGSLSMADVWNEQMRMSS